MSLSLALARRAVESRLESLENGRLKLLEAGGRGFGRTSGHGRTFGKSGGPVVEVEVLDPRFYRALALGGHVGAAESYAEGWWKADDLTALVRLFLWNRRVLDGLEGGWARLGQAARRVAELFNANTRAGSRANIRAHYDLSNEFFSLFLDETMAYSCAYFERPEMSLAEASVAKFERICRLLELSADDHLLEIGTGWGGFALHAARHYGCRVTTTTISKRQLELATAKVAQAGFAGRIQVVGLDYRDLEGRYDKLASIEMIEAVGHRLFKTYFERCAALLAPHGRLAIQAITIADPLYDAARREVDFIKRYIFPGSTLPSLTTLCQAASGTDLRLIAAQDIGQHYAETLRRWRANFMAEWPRLRALGFEERLLRIWELYFCYCEGGFDEGVLGDVQLGFAKPQAMANRPLPSLRLNQEAA